MGLLSQGRKDAGMDLAEFPLARIAEDERAAQAARDRDSRAYDWAWLLDKGFIRVDTTHIARHDPAHVLAECEAKRRIVTTIGDWCGEGASPDANGVLEVLEIGGGGLYLRRGVRAAPGRSTWS
jgi:hypothetical protein